MNDCFAVTLGMAEQRPIPRDYGFALVHLCLAADVGF